LIARISLITCIVETPMEINLHLRPTDGQPHIDLTRYFHTVENLFYLDVIILLSLFPLPFNSTSHLLCSCVIFMGPLSLYVLFHAHIQMLLGLATP
jgi:hypothetical protein